MGKEIETPFGNRIASFLEYMYDKDGYSILPLLRDKYGIDPWSLGEFKTLARHNQLNLYYLNSGNIEILRFTPSAGVLKKLTSVSYDEICDFILESLNLGDERLVSARKHGSLGLLGGALSKLLPISAQAAAQMISQLPRENTTQIAKIIAPLEKK